MLQEEDLTAEKAETAAYEKEGRYEMYRLFSYAESYIICGYFIIFITYHYKYYNSVIIILL